MNPSMQFDAVSEERPGPRWQRRWRRSWPAYRRWFLARGGRQGPSRAAGEAALRHHMPELVPVWKRLAGLAGGDDLSARFLSTWCPPAYLGGCSLAAVSRRGATRLVRNYDLSPELNEGLLLRSAWTSTPVMGMVEFLWGLSDGVNAKGLAIALAFGGRDDVAEGFGITTILRYVMETCATVSEALAVLNRVPSHMAYNVALADASGMTLSVELQPGGGLRVREDALATNHQHGIERATRPLFTRTHERLDHLRTLISADVALPDLTDEFLRAPLHQSDYRGGLGTLFTAEYDPSAGALVLLWRDGRWTQTLAEFTEGSRRVTFSQAAVTAADARATSRSGAAIGHASDAAWLEQLAVIAPYALDPAAFREWLRSADGAEPDWTTFAGAWGVHDGAP